MPSPLDGERELALLFGGEPCEPPGVFAPGGVELVLEGRAATEWSVIGRYPVSLGP